MGKQRDAVLTELRRRITHGYYRPGQLFSENDVVAELHDLKVTRQPVREAFSILAQEGLLEQIPRRGVAVRHMGRSETREVLRLRRSLERTVVDELAKSNDPDRLYGVDQLLKEMQAAADDGDTTTFLDLDSEFHRRLAENAGFSTAARILRTLRDKVRVMGLDAVEHTHDLAGANEQHRALVRAIADNDAVRAVRLIEQHADATGRRLLGEVTVGLPAKVTEIGNRIQKARDMRHRGRELGEVIAVLEDAVELAQQSDELHHELVQAQLELAATRRLNRDFRTAEKHALQALEVSELHGDRAGEAWANYELGRIALDDRDPVRPGDISRLSQALAMFEDDNPAAINNPRLRGWINYSLALKERRSDPHSAQSYAQQALHIFREGLDRYGTACALDLLGQLAADRNDDSDAYDYFAQAQDMATREGYLPVRANAVLHKAELAPTRPDLTDTEGLQDEIEAAFDLYASMGNAFGMGQARKQLQRLQGLSGKSTAESSGRGVAFAGH